MFDSVLIANRGEIARRVIRTLRSLGIGSVAVYAPADRNAPHVLEADAAVPISSYLDIEDLIGACRATGAQALHPGYGFIEEYPVCRFYRDAKILTIGEGTDEIQQMVIARALGA